MILKNGYVFIDGKFVQTDIEICNGIISSVAKTEKDGIDCTGKYIIPGLVDIHTHGCIGYDFSSAQPEDIKKMRKYYLRNGITSIFATTVTLSDEDIKKAVCNIKEGSSDDDDASDILGINIEGPYLSPKKCGAHDISLLKEPDIDFIRSLGDIIKIVDLDPDYETSLNFIEQFKGKCSIAHTDCSYDTAMRAIRAGADHITHIFNAMNGLHHREPGVIGAFFDTDAYAEIICDTIHIAPPVLRMIFSSKADRLVIISDSMSATGLDDGEYTLGKLHVHVKNSVAALDDGTLAGSTMNVFDMMKKLITIGVDIETAVKAATQNPADSAGISDKAGYIKPGYNANIVILNDNTEPETIIFRGNIIKTEKF